MTGGRAGATEGAGHAISPTGWTGLVALSLFGTILVGALIAALGIYAPVIVSTGAWSAVVLGSAGTATLIGLSVTSILAGAAIERMSARIVIGAGLVLAALGCFLSAWAAGAPVFVAGFGLIGAGTGFATTVPGIALISRWFGARRGFGLGLYFAALAVAAAIIPLLVAMALDSWDWKLVMRWTGAAVAASLLLLPLLQAPAPDKGERVAEASAGELSPGAALRNGNVWRIGAAIILSQLATQSVLFTVVGYLGARGISLTAATAIYATANLLTAPAVIGAGLLADRFGAARVLVPAFWLQAAGSAALLAAMLPGPLRYLALAAFVLGWGATSSVALQTGPVLLRALVGERHYALILSYVVAAAGLVGALAPVISALIEEAFDNYRPVYLLCAVFCGLAAVAVPRRKRL